MSALIDLLRSYEDLPEFVELKLVGVNQKGSFGNTPLHVAVAQGDLKGVKVLLEHGADPNIAGELGNTPLHDVSVSASVEVLQLLLDASADPSRLNEFDQTARDAAAASGNAALVAAFDAHFKAGNSAI